MKIGYMGMVMKTKIQSQSCWFWHLVVVLILSFAESQTSFATDITVDGYELGLNYREVDWADKHPPRALGNDPLLGRLACPALTRLNLATQKSEPLLLRSVEVVSAKQWVFESRRDLYWWSGDRVAVKEISEFISDQLRSKVSDRSQGRWQLPQFNIRVEGVRIVLTWQSEPAFGPFILNGLPLFRRHAVDTTKNEKEPLWECAGLYKLTLGKRDGHASVFLTPASSYGKNNLLRPSIRIGGGSGDHLKPSIDPGSRAGQPSKPARILRFAMATQLESLPIMSDKNSPCQQSVSLPFASMIRWNTKVGPTRASEVRKALTHLTPRGELIRAGAAGMGDLLSAPLPRNHPGYNRNVAVRSYQPEVAAALLDKAGYRRSALDLPRLDPSGKPLVLRIGVPEGTGALIQKVIQDAYMLAGAKVELVRVQRSASELTDANGLELNGVLTAIWWADPEVDFRASSAPSGTKEGNLSFWQDLLDDRGLADSLDAWLKSATVEKPNFALLQAVHSRLFELEPVTPLMQHRACAFFEGAGWHSARNLDPADPDWLRKLIL